MERFGRMMNTAHIDKKKLWQQVEDVLQQKQTATLREVIETVGLNNGLAEVVAYFSFLKEKGGRVQAIEKITELIPLNETQTRFVEVPYLLFSKQA